MLGRAENVGAAAQQRKTMHKNLSFASAEAYKLLRTNLQFILPGEDEARCRVIGVVSSIHGEGKSTTALNLSYVLAENGKRVLLIDGDMRLPSVGKNMEMPNAPGLSNVLISSGKDAKIVVRPSGVIDNWFILTSGDIPPNPSELLGSKRMRSAVTMLVEKFDYIIVDLPPVNVVPDSLVISSLLDGYLLVVRENYTSSKEVAYCVNQLKLVNAKILGFVMNCAKENHKRYGRYNRYSRYGKYYGQQSQEE